MKILILGVNGFIGHAISQLILERTDWQVFGMDLSDDRIAELNRQWRGKSGPTNVLSFPLVELTPGAEMPPMLGDIVIAFETVAREAQEQEKPFVDHLTHLLVHGLLHLVGYDHMNDDEAETMEALERRILQRLAIPDPYA